MAWTPFSYEAVNLHTLIRKLDNEGRMSAAVEAISVALELAHKNGPSNVSYEQAVAEWEALATQPAAGSEG